MNIQDDHTFSQRCIKETASGLCSGLSHFSKKSRVAVIYKIHSTEELLIHDPDTLLDGHAPKLQLIFNEHKKWPTFSANKATCHYSHLAIENEIILDGIIAFGCHSASVFYQVWFTERHPDICSPLPAWHWLKHAAIRFSHDIANKENLYTGISGNFLKEYGQYSVLDSLTSQLSHLQRTDSQLPLQNILQSILGISKTYEEGSLPKGKLAFISKEIIKGKLTIEFELQDQPLLSHYKHVRKLLQSVEATNFVLVSDGFNIIGISESTIASSHLVAEFTGYIGYVICKTEVICSFTDGRFHSSTFQEKLVELEDLLLDYPVPSNQDNSLFLIAKEIVHHAQRNNFGCTLVIDLSPDPIKISCQSLAFPISLTKPKNLQLGCNLAKVDGALHIGINSSLYGFACLLDGISIEGEDRSRGARYNSALRFSAAHRDAIILVVSSDRRPVATIYRGMELDSYCPLPFDFTKETAPQQLIQWLGHVAA